MTRCRYKEIALALLVAFRGGQKYRPLAGPDGMWRTTHLPVEQAGRPKTSFAGDIAKYREIARTI